MKSAEFQHNLIETYLFTNENLSKQDVAIYLPTGVRCGGAGALLPLLGLGSSESLLDALSLLSASCLEEV